MPVENESRVACNFIERDRVMKEMASQGYTLVQVTEKKVGIMTTHYTLYFTKKT